MEKIAEKFFRHDAAKLEGDFKKTDLCKFLELQYGEMVYVNSPGFFISVYKKGTDTYVFDKMHYDFAKHYQSFTNDSLVEVGCWVPVSMRKFVYRKQPSFPEWGFELSRSGYTVIDIEEKDLDPFKVKKSELDPKRMEKFFHKYVDENTLFSRLNRFDFAVDLGSNSVEDLIMYRKLNQKSMIGMLLNICNPEKARKILHVSTHSWYGKYQFDRIANSFSDALVEFYNQPHAQVDLRPNSIVLLNMHNPKFCYGITSNGKHSTFEMSEGFKSL